jgi:hypothetical protein
MEQSNAMEFTDRVKLPQEKEYEKKPYGFDRTQMYKEHVDPQMRRQSALKSSIALMEAHELNLFGIIPNIPTQIECLNLIIMVKNGLKMTSMQAFATTRNR